MMQMIHFESGESTSSAEMAIEWWRGGRKLNQRQKRRGESDLQFLLRMAGKRAWEMDEPRERCSFKVN